MTANTKWIIDTGHSEIRFKVKHLAVANVSGVFRDFRGKVSCANDNFENATVDFEIVSESLDTNNKDRDVHLRSQLFFDVERFPGISFSGVLQKEQDDYRLIGDLTILETTKRVALDVSFAGIATGRFNDVRAGFEIEGKINRKDFGLNFDLLNDAGDLVVGNDIKISGDIELIKQ